MRTLSIYIPELKPWTGMVHVSHIRKINKEGVRILPHIRKLLSALIEITTQYLLIHTEQSFWLERLNQLDNKVEQSWLNYINITIIEIS